MLYETHQYLAFVEMTLLVTCLLSVHMLVSSLKSSDNDQEAKRMLKYLDGTSNFNSPEPQQLHGSCKSHKRKGSKLCLTNGTRMVQSNLRYLKCPYNSGTSEISPSGIDGRIIVPFFRTRFQEIRFRKCLRPSRKNGTRQTKSLTGTGSCHLADHISRVL